MNLKKILIIVSCAVIAGVGIVLYAFWHFEREIREPLRMGGETISLTIERGWGEERIGQELHKAGLIRHEYYFYYAVWRMESEGNLRAGDYLFSPGISTIDIASEIIGKGIFSDVSVTFPEGFTLRDIEKRLALNGFSLNLREFKIADFSADYSILEDAPRDATLEGFLFPDTYFFSNNLSEKEIINKFLSNFNRQWEDIIASGAQSNRPIYETVIMASLIEQEVRSLEDRKLVSGILWKRLQLGIALQVDATILYVKELHDGMKESDGRDITLEDLRIDSPYNTYRFVGLPPGPIANPGIDSLAAALLPVESEYLFYLSKPDGTTVFSRTLEEHNIARAKYLR